MSYIRISIAEPLFSGVALLVELTAKKFTIKTKMAVISADPSSARSVLALGGVDVVQSSEYADFVVDITDENKGLVGMLYLAKSSVEGFVTSPNLEILPSGDGIEEYSVILSITYDFNRLSESVTKYLKNLAGNYTVLVDKDVGKVYSLENRVGFSVMRKLMLKERMRGALAIVVSRYGGYYSIEF